MRLTAYGSSYLQCRMIQCLSSRSLDEVALEPERGTCDKIFCILSLTDLEGEMAFSYLKAFVLSQTCKCNQESVYQMHPGSISAEPKGLLQQNVQWSH